MSRIRVVVIVLFALISSFSFAQIDTVTIGAGTPEDKDLTAIGNEQDAQKKISMYQEFLQKYSANPIAVAFANWQLAQAYQSSGDLQKAIEAGDKALAASPRNLDILSSQVGIAQQMKDSARAFNYAAQGGEFYNSIDKQTKPADMTDDVFQSTVQAQKQNNKGAYQFFQNSALSVIAGENDAKTRMSYVDKFSAAFPKSDYDDQVTSYALASLADLGDNKRLIAYAEKVLAVNPDDLTALVRLALTYVESADTAGKAITYGQRVITAAKPDDPNTDSSKKVLGGIAHCVIGRAYTLQGKNLPAIAELKTATSLLKGHDEQQYAVAAYFLGWNYAKLNKIADARAILGDAADISGPMQGTIKELLAKVNAAKATGK